MKIVYCINSIQVVGGIATAVKTKANALAEKGHEVFIAVSDHNSAIPVDLSNKIILKDLKVKYYEDDWKSKINVLKGILIKRKIHKKRLSHFLNQVEPDIVISVGQCEKYFLPEIKGKWKFIREFHYDKSYRLRASNSLFQKLLAHIINIYEYKFKIWLYDKVVVLTEKDKNINWKNDPKVIVINNPIEKCVNKTPQLQKKKIVTVGRLVKQKNYTSLINAFRLVIMKHPDWQLDIYGDGELKEQLEKEIYTKELTKRVFLKGNKTHIQEFLNGYSIFVMSSIYEGMPMAMLEAMSCGLPIVSYECPYGPGELIKDGENGYLVPVNDEVTLAKKICDLIEDYNGRKEMGRMSFMKVQKYYQEKICDQWINLFEKL